LPFDCVSAHAGLQHVGGGGHVAGRDVT